MFELKLYEEIDRDLYLKSQKETFEKYVIEFFGNFNQKIMEEHLEILKDGLFKIMVNNEIAGFVYFKEEQEKIIVDVFCLFSNYRNSGLGSCVMNSFIKKANELNKPIVLDTFKTNPAKKFYERHGFKVIDENNSHFILKYTPVLEDLGNVNKRI